jgi:hypothetical protein
VAQDEVKKYGPCQPYTDVKKTGVPNYFSSPYLPSDDVVGTPYPGPKCQRLTKNPSTLLYFWKAAAQAKEMLAVAPSYHGGLDDIMAELPEFRCDVLRCFARFILFIYFFFFRFSLTRDEFDKEIEVFLDYFRKLCEKFKKEIINNGFVGSNGNNDKLDYIFSFSLCFFFVYSGTPSLDNVVVQLLGGSTRIPAIQKILLDVFNQKELGKLLNQDEAPAIGLCASFFI